MVNTPQGSLSGTQPTTTNAATTLQRKVQGKISRRGFIFGTGAAVVASIAWHGATQFDPSADIASLHTTLMNEIAQLRKTIQSKVRNDFASIITRANFIHDTAAKLAQLDNVSGAFTGMTGKGAFVKSMSSIQNAMKTVVSAIQTCEKTTQITNAQPLSTGVGIEELSVIIKEIIPVTALAKTTEAAVGQLQIRDFTQNPSGVTPEQWNAFRKHHGDLSLEIYKLLLEIQSLQRYAEEMQKELQYRQDAIPTREAQKRRNLLEEWTLFHILAGGATAALAWFANNRLENPPTKSAWDQ